MTTRTIPSEDDDQGAVTAARTPLQRIPGRPLDPPTHPKPAKVREIGRRHPWAAVVLAAADRFKAARSPVMAAGTAYYGFLAMFSLLAFAYGVAAILSADAIADWLTDTLEGSLPGLVGEGGIDPGTLERVGQTTSVIGLVVLLISGTAVVGAASDSLHRVYGAPLSGRNPVLRRIHLLGWLVVLGPLVLLSYSMSTAVNAFGEDLLDALDIDGSVTRWLVLAAATALTFLLDVGISALMLARLGGIEPSRWAILPGAVLAALVVTAFKALAASIIAWSVERPQFGSFAVPVTILFVLWFQSMGLYAGGCVTAARASVPEPAAG